MSFCRRGEKAAKPERRIEPLWKFKEPAPYAEDDASAVVAVCMLMVAFGVGVLVGVML